MVRIVLLSRRRGRMRSRLVGKARSRFFLFRILPCKPRYLVSVSYCLPQNHDRECPRRLIPEVRARPRSFMHCSLMSLSSQSNQCAVSISNTHKICQSTAYAHLGQSMKLISTSNPQAAYLERHQSISVLIRVNLKLWSISLNPISLCRVGCDYCMCAIVCSPGLHQR